MDIVGRDVLERKMIETIFIRLEFFRPLCTELLNRCTLSFDGRWRKVEEIRYLHEF